MNYNMLKFLPYYPKIDEPEFNSVIYSKKELNDLKVPAFEKFPETKGDLLTHQLLISRLLSTNTQYDNILLMHDMGTGKTCSASAIIEQIRSENSSIKSFIYVAKNSSLLQQFEQQFREKCTKTDMSSIGKLSTIGLQTMTHDKFSKIFLNSNGKVKTVMKNALDDKLIIIDEVHNIRESGGSLYSDYHLLLHSMSNSKIVLMSGTPMTDMASEFASVMNLILPLDKQIPTGAKFDDTFIENNALKNTGILRESIKGRISYIKTMQTNVVKRFNGETIDGFVTNMKLSPSYMSEQQTLHYSSAKQLDANEDSRSPAYTNSLQASDFVTIDGKYGPVIDENKFRFSPGTKQDMMKELKTLSAKYADSLTTILQAGTDKKCSFVFNKNVSGGGLNMFARILNLFGYTKVNMSNVNNIKSTTGSKRYILLTGETTDKETLINRFNKDDNVDGSVISVILASDAISEGYSFNNIQVIDIHSPWFNFAKTSQAIARGIRTGSHSALEKRGESKIFVDIYLRVSYPLIGESIDILTYSISEKKDVIIKQIEHIIKEESIDSRLAYARNSRSSELDNTRECDYTVCKYEPYPTEQKLTLETDYSTFEDYKGEYTKLDKAIKDILEKNIVIDFENIKNELKEFSEFEIISSLVDIIDKNIPFTINDKICFLREDKNILYLTHSISNVTSIFDSYYVMNKYTDKEPVLQDILEDVVQDKESNQLDISKISSIIDLNEKTIYMTPMEKELLLEQSISLGMPNEFIQEKFKELHGNIGDKYYSWYLLSKNKTVRVLKNNEWVDGDDDDKTIVEEELADRLVKVRLKATQLFDPLNENKDIFYGLYTYTDEFVKGKKIKKFSIVKIIESDDKRDLSTGKDCSSWTGSGKQDLDYIINTIGDSITKLKAYEKCTKIENLFQDNDILLRQG